METTEKKCVLDMMYYIVKTKNKNKKNKYHTFYNMVSVQIVHILYDTGKKPPTGQILHLLRSIFFVYQTNGLQQLFQNTIKFILD